MPFGVWSLGRERGVRSCHALVLWATSASADALSRRRRRQRPGADRERSDRGLVSCVADQADDRLCRARRGAQRQADHGHAARRVRPRGEHAAVENGLSPGHRGDARQRAQDADGQVAQRPRGDGRRGHLGFGRGFRRRDERGRTAPRAARIAFRQSERPARSQITCPRRATWRSSPARSCANSPNTPIFSASARCSSAIRSSPTITGSLAAIPAPTA